MTYSFPNFTFSVCFSFAFVSLILVSGASVQFVSWIGGPWVDTTAYLTGLGIIAIWCVSTGALAAVIFEYYMHKGFGKRFPRPTFTRIPSMLAPKALCGLAVGFGCLSWLSLYGVYISRNKNLRAIEVLVLFIWLCSVTMAVMCAYKLYQQKEPAGEQLPTSEQGSNAAADTESTPSNANQSEADSNTDPSMGIELDELPAPSTS